MLRLQKAYMLYCFLCFLLSIGACIWNLGRVAHTKVKGADLRAHRWHPMETAVDGILGFIVCAEAVTMMWLSGRREFLRNAWGVLDAGVVALTLVTWCLLALRNTELLGDRVLHLDLPLLSLRFILQFGRVFAAASMTKRIFEMQQHTVDIAFDVLENVDSMPGTPQSGRQVVSVELQAAISGHLPAWCRHQSWQLAFSTATHGASMDSFYWQQARHGGANVLAVRDTAGGIFGSFVTEPWRHCSQGFHGSSECFVFSCRPGEPMQFYHAEDGEADVILSGDDACLGLSRALHLQHDFASGSSSPCASFSSPPLASEGEGFIVCTVECWHFV